MPESSLKIELEAAGTDADAQLMRLFSFLDTSTVIHLERAFQTLYGGQKWKIVVDFGGTQFVSSAGWGYFVSQIKKIRLHGGDLKFVGLSAKLFDTFKSLDFGSIFKRFDTVEEALRDF